MKLKSYSEILHDLRKDNKLTQGQIGELLGTTQQQYSKYETEGTELTVRALITLADYYGKSTDYILGRTSREDGMVSASEKITDEYSAGGIVSELILLSPANRATAVEFILFLKMRESAIASSKKDD